jgi:hypothetical protein
MLSRETIDLLTHWLRHSFASRFVDHVLFAHFVTYGDDIADYFEYILDHNDYSADEKMNALRAAKFLLDKSLYFEKLSPTETKRRVLRARILSGEFGQFPPTQDLEP